MSTKKTKTFILFFLCAMLVSAATVAEAQDRRIAVAADGADASATVDERTARAPFILIFDGTGELVESHKNPITRARGAGPALAQWLVEKNVDTLIGGDIGPNLAQAIGARQINWEVKRGPVSEAVKDVLR